MQCAPSAGTNSPMTPHERLDALGLDPGTVAELALLDLDFLVLAFFVLAPSAGAFGFFCEGVSKGIVTD